jgi:ankyrin repeat protein
MTTELWQAVRTSDIEHVKELLQHMKQLHNDPLSVAVAPVTPRNVSDPQLNVEERGMSTSQSTVPAISDSMSSITKSPRSDDSIGSPPSTPKSPESGQSSSRGRLLATNEFWCEVLNAVDDQGFTSLTWAVLLAKEELIVLLLEHGADPNVADLRGHTPLLWAVDKQDINSLRVLLKYKRASNINLNHQDLRGMTALHRAAAYGNLRFMQMLREAGARLSVRDSRGWSALHMAAYYNRPEVIEFIVHQGFSIDEPNKDGWTALHLSALMGHQDLVKSLTKQLNANPMACSVWGQTPLHVAVEAEKEDIARILIEEGASPDVRDNFGKLPEDEATQDMLFILKKTTCNISTTADYCTASGSGLTAPVINREAKFTIQARDQRGHKRFFGGDSFDVRIVRLVDDIEIPLDHLIYDNGDGTYTVKYLPSALGAHQITIKLGYITINGSPFTTEVLEKRLKKQDSRHKHRSEVPRSPRIQSPAQVDSAPLTPNGSSPDTTETPRSAELNLSPTALLRQMPKFTSPRVNGSSKRVKHHDAHHSDTTAHQHHRSKRATINFGDASPIQEQLSAPTSIRKHSDAAPPRVGIITKKAPEEEPATAAPVVRERRVVVTSNTGAVFETSPDRLKKSPGRTDSPRKPGPDSRIITKSEPLRPAAVSVSSGSQVELNRRMFELQTANQKLQNDLKTEQQQSMQLKQQLQQLERRVQQTEASNTCLACNVLPRSAVLSPCHHLLHCYGCACKYSACPNCWIKINTVIEIKRQ